MASHKDTESSTLAYLDCLVGMVFIKDSEFRISWANKTAEQTLNIDASEMINKKCFQLLDRTTPCENCPLIEAFKTGRKTRGKICSPSGRVWNIEAIPFKDKEGEIPCVLQYTIEAERYLRGDFKNTESMVRESDARFENLADSLGVTVVEMDTCGVITYFNRNATKVFGYSAEILSDNFQALWLIHPNDRSKVIDNFLNRLNGKLFFRKTYEYTMIRKDGSKFPALVWANPIIEEGHTVGLRSIYLDITEQKQTQQYLEYAKHHDALTGLYTRQFLEDKLSELENEDTPAGIIIADIDGLKIVNDTFGHEEGDSLLKKTAEAIKSCLYNKDIAARTGGDEFTVLLLNTNETFVKTLCNKIKKAASDSNLDKDISFPFSLSTGWAIAYDEKNINEVFKQADDNMYRGKLHKKQSTKSTIVKTLMKALEAKDPLTKDHAEHIHTLIRKMGIALNLSERTVDDLCLFAQFHDIGKIGVSDKILLKPGPLTTREKITMQRHCEIGHRIAISSPELAPIADWILKHHEWWDGSGYPLGIKEKQIPFECRLLAIIDAYDAMISLRLYRKTISHEEAVKELRRCAGTQFDPKLVEAFIEINRQPPANGYECIQESL